jgi:hypothetical protein
MDEFERPAMKMRQSCRSVSRQMGRFEAVNRDRVGFGSNLEGERVEECLRTLQGLT